MKKIILLTCVSALLVLACKGGSGETTSDAQGAGAAREAPEFVQLAAEGKLPPLAERLPKNPRVITPYEKVGVYGGDWRVAQVGGHLTHVHRYQYYENLVNWTPGWGDIVPNVAESYEVSPDSREYTFHLREGMKWSDGQPFSVDDVEFWFVDVLSNPQVTPSPDLNLTHKFSGFLNTMI
ncbi:MAG: ABC transporter substrate-binding protein [Treponema sp.]|jgi:peptide/nickel transport system substrate-binding protein|nr:ABC transporter substrate-binding protein [Treponema sp.]